MQSLPEGFCYLKHVDSSIQQSVRYYTNENFGGRRVEGYLKNEIVLTCQAAAALKYVQSDLNQQGLSLVVYDGYRPQRAVDYFMRWSQDSSDQLKKHEYYPTEDKSTLFDQGYIATKSGHSRGSTVDLTLIPLGKQVITGDSTTDKIDVVQRTVGDGSSIPYLNDNTMDMGSSFDLFHPVSWINSSALFDSTSQYMQNRDILNKVMKKHGFKDYDHEWWHFTLANEPFPDTYFDFVLSDEDQIIENRYMQEEADANVYTNKILDILQLFSNL
eukprot:403344292